MALWVQGRLAEAPGKGLNPRKVDAVARAAALGGALVQPVPGPSFLGGPVTAPTPPPPVIRGLPPSPGGGAGRDGRDCGRDISP